MRRSLVMVSLLLASGCPLLEDGPGFYGQVVLAGSQGSAAKAPADPNPLLKQAARLFLPNATRGVPPLTLRVPMELRARKPTKAAIVRRPEAWRVGEVIVATVVPQRASMPRLRASLGERIASRGWLATLVRCNTSTQCLWQVTDSDGKRLDATATRRAAELMRGARDIKRAEVNGIRYAMAVPNDEYRSLQWHYDLMNLPSAWDVTTGDSGVAVAVLDTGLSMANPDFSGRLGQGADMISESSISNDGDGRDNNADDPGDDVAGGGSFHGTHCAGTVGAATNNRTGVSGVSWSGTLLPVRVLGVGGGTDFDIMGGIYWAIGDEVEGVNRNSRPADVLSLSLGGAGRSQSWEDAINAAISRGSLVFVAAGNENQDAANVTPANVPAAITVGAVGYSGRRAPYSNYGGTVDIMAPGGDLARDEDGDGYADGVLSTVATSVDFLQGTSMATPHVAGLGVLMKALKPDLTQGEADQILKDTARSEYVCDECGGARLVDAAAVVAQLGAAQNGPFLSVTPNQVQLGKDQNSATINIRNSGVGTLEWTARIEASEPGWSLSPTSGTLEARTSGTAALSLSRAGREGDAVLVITGVGLNQERRVQLHYDESVPRAKPNVSTVFLLAATMENDELALAKDVNGEDVFDAAEQDENFAYKLQPLPAGEYLIIGLTDDNGNGDWEEGEGMGFYPDLTNPQFVTLEEEQKLEGLNFIVRPTFLGGGTTCPPNSHAEGDSCVCDSGYVVNDDGSGCIPGGEIQCPPNSHPEGDTCYCDDGYVVNEDLTACVPE